MTFRNATIVSIAIILLMWLLGVIDVVYTPTGGIIVRSRILNECNFLRPCEVVGLVGSEKERFFEDERVIRELRRWGLKVIPISVGSHEMVRRCEAANIDFLFPAGTAADSEIGKSKECTNVQTQQTLTWRSPLVIVARERPFKALQADGAVFKEGGLNKAHIERIFKYVAEEKYWSELKNNLHHRKPYPIVLRTTDTSSNSATQMCALASTQLKNRLPKLNDVEEVADFCYRILCVQGEKKHTTRPNWEDFLQSHEDAAPFVLVYEQLYKESESGNNKRHPLPKDEQVFLIYPKPTIITSHTYLFRTQRGRMLFDALQSDALVNLAIEHGFRVNDPLVNANHGFPDVDTLRANPDLEVVRKINERINEKNLNEACPSKR